MTLLYREDEKKFNKNVLELYRPIYDVSGK